MPPPVPLSPPFVAAPEVPAEPSVVTVPPEPVLLPADPAGVPPLASAPPAPPPPRARLPVKPFSELQLAGARASADEPKNRATVRGVPFKVITAILPATWARSEAEPHHPTSMHSSIEGRIHFTPRNQFHGRCSQPRLTERSKMRRPTARVRA